MLYNLSVKDIPQQEEIDYLVGAPFSWKERLRRRGIGSPRLFIKDYSQGLVECFNSSSDRKLCNVELRPRGVIIRFRSMLDTYGLVIPFRMLTFYQNGSLWSFHSTGEYLKVKPESLSKSNRKFILKMMALRNQNVGGPLNFEQY